MGEKRTLRLAVSWCGTTGRILPSADSPGSRNFSIAQIFRPAHFGQTRECFMLVRETTLAPLITSRKRTKNS